MNTGTTAPAPFTYTTTSAAWTAASLNYKTGTLLNTVASYKLTGLPKVGGGDWAIGSSDASSNYMVFEVEFADAASVPTELAEGDFTAVLYNGDDVNLVAMGFDYPVFPTTVPTTLEIKGIYKYTGTGAATRPNQLYVAVQIPTAEVRGFVKLESSLYDLETADLAANNNFVNTQVADLREAAVNVDYTQTMLTDAEINNMGMQITTNIPVFATDNVTVEGSLLNDGAHNAATRFTVHFNQPLDLTNFTGANIALKVDRAARTSPTIPVISYTFTGGANGVVVEKDYENNSITWDISGISGANANAIKQFFRTDELSTSTTAALKQRVMQSGDIFTFTITSALKSVPDRMQGTNANALVSKLMYKDAETVPVVVSIANSKVF